MDLVYTLTVGIALHGARKEEMIWEGLLLSNDVQICQEHGWDSVEYRHSVDYDGIHCYNRVEALSGQNQRDTCISQR